MKKLLFILLLISIIFSEKYPDITEGIELIRVYDGDTIWVNIKGYPDIVGKNIAIRINGIDTPEIRTKNKGEKKLGYKAKDFLKKLLKTADKIELRNIQRGKYFRIVADLYIIKETETDVKQLMIINGHAVEYDGGTKTKVWAEEDE